VRDFSERNDKQERTHMNDKRTRAAIRYMQSEHANASLSISGDTLIVQHENGATVRLTLAHVINDIMSLNSAIRDAVNYFGDGDHPRATKDNLDQFGDEYVVASMRKALDSADVGESAKRTMRAYVDA
jgi:hypothetical protein